MPYNSRHGYGREYAGSSTGGILRRGGGSSGDSASSFSNNASSAAFGEAKQIDLLVFGYACKVFRDDDRAREIDQGKHLIPWMGDSNLKIDRYDVRGALCDLQQYEAPAGGYGNRLDYLSAEEQRAEQLCEEERYIYLYNNEEQLVLDQEEELKRFKRESASCSYNQVGLQYDTLNRNGVEHGPKGNEFSNSPTCEESVQSFVLPHNFVVPTSLKVPETMKQHAIIEKTARFIASQGIQMEILLKAKQSNNLQFEFLTQNSLLNPYYKLVLNAIKEGTYPAAETSQDIASDELCREQEAHSDLEEPALADSRSVVTVPTIKYKPSANCAYTQLISKIKGVPLPEVIEEHTATSAVAREDESSAASNSATNALGSSTADGENFTPVLLQYNGQTYVTADNENASNSTKTESSPRHSESTTTSPPKVEILKKSSALMLAQNYSSGSESEAEESSVPKKPINLSFPIPAENLRSIIDKTASYVIKNGRQFEETLRSKSEDRFTFLLPENEFYPYYMYKVTGDPDAASLERKTRRAAAVAAALMSKKRLLQATDKNSAHVSFSLKSKEDQLQPALPQEHSDEDEHNVLRSSGTDAQLRSVPEHVKKAIQLVESQLMARNAQLAVSGGASGTVLPCSMQQALQSRFDTDYNSHSTKSPAISNAEMERNALYEQQQQNRHRELKRAEEKVKDKLAQIAREKLGGLISKEKQLQLERKRKALAFLNQIKGSGENVSTPDRKPANNNDGNASDNSEASVHSIPISYYGPDEKTDNEEENSPPPPPPPPSFPPILGASSGYMASPQREYNKIIKLSPDITLSDDDDVQIVSETSAHPTPATFHKRHKSKSRHHRRPRSCARDKYNTGYHTPPNITHSHTYPVESLDTTAETTTQRSHKRSSKKSSTKSHSKKVKSKSKRRRHSRSRSRSPSRPRSKSYHSSLSTFRTSHSRHSRSVSVESMASPATTKRHREHSKRSKRSHSPKTKDKHRKREHY